MVKIRQNYDSLILKMLHTSLQKLESNSTCVSHQFTNSTKFYVDFFSRHIFEGELLSLNHCLFVV